MIYGPDDRHDIFSTQVTDLRHYTELISAMIPKEILSQDEDEFNLRPIGTLSEVMGVCEDVRFSSDIVAANCTAVLIAPNILLTAGHCVAPNSDFDDPLAKCHSHYFVFDYMDDKTSFSQDEVYECENVIFSEEENLDYALVILSKNVSAKTSLNINYFSAVKENTEVFTLGFPSGLPMKIATDGQVLSNSKNADLFYTNLDTFSANSGSPVINFETGELEGIIVNGNFDYVLSDPTDPFSCLVENRCDSFGENCVEETDQIGEGVLKIEKMLPLIFKYVKPQF